MECSLPPTYNTESTASAIKTMQADHIPSKSVLHVNFDTDPEDVHERKKKYLTAKYGQHQMSLIRKRLRVEMWMYEQLQLLYGCRDDAQTYDVEIDLDELLDLEGDSQRRDWLRTKLEGAKQPAEVIEKFIAELLQRAKTL
ncbi:protein phosphatase 1 regulatory subunit 14C-like [Centruroides vittatus]|uniref:protein phosphatase 1 regulatory subunit 14C-like n=1 Tax=Centruroides sculpturatus TaxID=218467 RepID=UPI000C6EC236|nr:protein phosphatase 1 regulatory subunit 14C-like [Centruroides sculpturatus]